MAMFPIARPSEYDFMKHGAIYDLALASVAGLRNLALKEGDAV